MLTTAGLLVEAGVILKKGAAQVTAADFSQVERVARELCAGSLVAAKQSPSLDDGSGGSAAAWTSGEGTGSTPTT